MNATIKSIDHVKASGIEYSGAPSLTSAIRDDAETIVKVAREHNIEDANDCLCKNLRGAVSCDLMKVGEAYLVEFYKDKDIKPFARVIVK